MSMWSPQPPPHPQSLGPRAVGRCCCCCCFPACQGLASPLPAPPSPSQGCGDSSRGLEKAKLPKLQSPPVPSARLGVLTPRLVCHLSQRATPRPSAHGPPQSLWQTKPVVEPYLAHLGLPAWSGMPGLSVFIASTCAVLWAHWPATSAPRLGATFPGRPSPDPARTTVGPSVHSRRSRPLCLPFLPLPGQALGWTAQEPVPASPFLTRK